MKAEKPNRIKLSDGRHLAFVERGDPSGTPILFFHGTPGSRGFHHPDESVAIDTRARLIHIDRPGVGWSDPHPGRTLLDWPKDVVQVADALELETLAIAGVSGGGPHALACAWWMPERISSVAVISGMAPLDAQGAMDGMSAFNRVGLRIARHTPFLLPLALSPMARAGKKDPRSLLEKAALNYAQPDQRVMERPDVREMYITDIIESYRQGVRGHAGDLLAVSRSWGFDLAEISTPVQLWQGKQDQNIPPSMAEHMAGRIPKAQLRIFEDQGHLLMFDHWDEILSDIVNRQSAECGALAKNQSSIRP